MVHADLLVGTSTADDAGVFRIAPDLALVQTVDFFSPIVDDAYQFGAIAAANALSDVWAMGGEPRTALNIACFPQKDVPVDVLTDILRGGLAKAAEAGVVVVGGHTVIDEEVKFGMAVTGFVHPDRILSNDKARAGDHLVLTKPLGSGILSTAIKRGNAPGAAPLVGADTVKKITEIMATLNRPAAEAALAAGARAATDVTGFGLMGHLHNILAASKLSARLNAAAIPMRPEVLPLAEQGVVPGGTKRNLQHQTAFVTWAPGMGDALKSALSDAQTSGGLLICCPPDKVSVLLADLVRRGTPAAADIGELVPGADSRITVVE